MLEGLKPCQFRQVDPQGRILCGLIKAGDREVSVNLCRACPVQAINCQNLRAGLEKHSPAPLTVRFATGRVEVWDNDPPTIGFKQAACAAKTMPITSPRDCAGCPIRMPNVIPQSAIQVAHRVRENKPAEQTFSPTTASSAPPAAPAAVVPTGRTPRPPRNPARRTDSTPLPVAATVTQSTRAARSPAVQAAAQPAAELTVAEAMVARAKQTAERKAAERGAGRSVPEPREAQPAVDPKSKIIQLQAWLSGQLTRKQAAQPLPVPPDVDGVSEIVYAPLSGPVAQAYQENPDYERCVGWTD